MILRKQPNPKGQCGQYCVSMITGKDPSEVLDIMGGQARTETGDLIEALGNFGFETDPKLIPFSKFPDEKITAILKVRFESGSSHWVVFDKFAVLDPMGLVCDLEEYQDRIINGKIMSFIRVWKK